MSVNDEMAAYTTPQEAFWAGTFGDAYSERNRGPAMLAANLALWAQVLRSAGPITSVIEFGANVGMNLEALRLLYPGQEQHAVEINASAATTLAERLPEATVTVGSLLDVEPSQTFDLAFVKGVLIHLSPDHLEAAYRALYAASHRYLVLAEYYNPTPVQVPYRGHEDRLFKRDFCGELLDHFPDLDLQDYGFVYHRDARWPQDDLTWFLLEKSERGVER